MKRISRAVAVGAIASALIGFGATSAHADAPVDAATISALVSFNPGATDETMLAFVLDAAERHGVTPEEFARSSLAEAQASVEESGLSTHVAEQRGAAGSIHLAGNLSGMSTNESTSSSQTLGTAQRKGDIFTAPATTLWIQHGHTGIYYTTATIIEAPGMGQVVKKTSASSIYVDPGAHKLYVTTTQAKRNAAADWAATKLGYGYNLFFADNKNVEDDVYNCSQLVWAAYKKKAALDIDANGGSSVYPVDIRNSSLTTSYKQF
jgi:uncharacterized protein YycO